MDVLARLVGPPRLTGLARLLYKFINSSMNGSQDKPCSSGMALTRSRILSPANWINFDALI